MEIIDAPPRPRHFISSSEPGHSCVFVTRAELEAYERDAAAVVAKHKKIIRDKYGIWAGNQGKFVASESDLNPCDSRDYV